MQTLYIIAILWLVGFLLAHWMLKIERAAEGEQQTNGEVVMAVILSILSWVIVLFMLINAWAASVKSYWSRPVKTKKPE